MSFVRQSSASSKRVDEDVYDFDSANVSTANLLIGATVSKLNQQAHGGSVQNGLNQLDQSGFPEFAPQAGLNAMRPQTGSEFGPRPMTSVKGAGYSSKGSRPEVFDPLQQSHGPAPPLSQKSQDSPEQMAREMEKQVNQLLEECALACFIEKDKVKSLERAKEAAKREKLLCRHREKAGLADQQNLDLTYAVTFNLANSYASSGNYSESINVYNSIVKNKAYPQAGRLRVNMGNIYYAEKKYPAAIKMYRMAMDQVGSMSREMKFKIMRNIGNSFLKLGQFQDAIHSYEAIMDQQPDAQAGFNLLLCYYALGDKEKMKKGFLQLLSVPEYVQESEEENELEMEFHAKKPQVVMKAEDELHKERKERKKVTQRYILMAARLMAPLIERDLSSGFDWIIEHLRMPIQAIQAMFQPNADALNNSNSSNKPGFPTLAMEMEIAKGIAFMKQNKLESSIEVFKNFEKNDSALIDQASTNLSFLYFLEGDFKNAEKYAEMAVKADRYNAKALVNKANTLYQRGELEMAKELFLEAIGVEADCVEAIYNLGLCNKRLGHMADALQAFKKLHRILPKDPQVVYQIAHLYEVNGDLQQAAHWFTTLHGFTPSDPKVLARLGAIFSKEDDETQAFHNFSDSYNVFPVNMEVISWLGVWYVKQELYEDAIQFFDRAAEIEPQEVKWRLMVASCHRRMNQLPQALALYKAIHKAEPENVECLRYLVSITKDSNDRDYDEYVKALRKAEKSQQQREAELNAIAGSGGAQSSGYMKESRHDDRDENQSDNHGGRSVSHDPGFDGNEFHANRSGPTINQGRQNQEDEWGDDGLGDELLPL